MTDRDDNPTTARIADAARDDQDEDEPIARERRVHGPETEQLRPLLGEEDAGRFRERWQSIQTTFVDEPRASVEQADGLVAELMQRLAETFAAERDGLESQWSRGEDVSTEDLRIALQRYRSFFERLLAA
jgi:hypothetical protein